MARESNLIQEVDLARAAFDLRKSEHNRGIDVWKQLGLLEALELAARLRVHVSDAYRDQQKLQARKGGLAKKRDELQVLICGIVKLNRDISNRGLRLNLERRTPGDVIDDVDREGIWFWHGNKL